MVIKCEGDDEMEVGEEGAREERWGATEAARNGRKIGKKERERRKRREELLEKERKVRESAYF